MESLYIKESFKTPEIKFNLDGQMSIKGISMGENIDTFYKPIFNWLSDFSNSNKKNINLTLFFEYLNTPSTNIIVTLLKELNHLKKNGYSVNMVWQYEEDDDSIQELGEDLETSSGSNFEFVAIKVS